MLIAYWIVAGLLALFNLFAGANKIVRSREQLAPMMAWAPAFPAWAVKAIGLAEVLGAIGLIVPPLTGIVPALALAAAIGLALLQLIAAIFHVVRGEAKQIGINVVALVLSVVAAVLAANVWL